MKLPLLSDLNVSGKRVIVRGDLDVDFEEVNGKRQEVKGDSIRLEATVGTLKYLLEKEAQKVIVIGHRGRPKGKEIRELSLEPLVSYFSEKLETHVSFVSYHNLSKLSDGSLDTPSIKVVLMENIRFWPEEEENKTEFAEFFARCADIYVNECFSASHRSHMSFIGLPKAVGDQSPETRVQRLAVGLRFAKEVEHLEKVRENPKRPVVVIISGVKEDKLRYIEPFKTFADKILVGGRLPIFLENRERDTGDKKVVVASLNQDKEDITIASIEKFEEEIEKAGTVVVAGPVGKYEEEGQRLGTQRVLQAVANSSAFKVAGGGDTQEALEMFNLTDKFDWVSVGGGAMLEFLANGTLPGIEVLL